ncbi:hypothetical protein K456DRAFT_1584227 [Colletotrichum gloeosporioides 23]|nr:hypothetical protein K456DRAFT_1584227 [Colletotrichum gloeosporioides 23]
MMLILAAAPSAPVRNFCPRGNVSRIVRRASQGSRHQSVPRGFGTPCRPSDPTACFSPFQRSCFDPLWWGVGEVVAKAQPGQPQIDRKVRHPALQAPRKTRPSVVHFPQQRPPARPLKSRA